MTCQQEGPSLRFVAIFLFFIFFARMCGRNAGQYPGDSSSVFHLALGARAALWGVSAGLSQTLSDELQRHTAHLCSSVGQKWDERKLGGRVSTLVVQQDLLPSQSCCQQMCATVCVAGGL